MSPIGGGALKSITHKHFWFTALTFAAIVAGFWFWHRLEIRQAVRTEQEARYQQFQAEQSSQK